MVTIEKLYQNSSYYQKMSSLEESLAAYEAACVTFKEASEVWKEGKRLLKKGQVTEAYVEELRQKKEQAHAEKRRTWGTHHYYVIRSDKELYEKKRDYQREYQREYSKINPQKTKKTYKKAYVPIPEELKKKPGRKPVLFVDNAPDETNN